MSNSILRDAFTITIDSVIREATNASQLGHRGLEGRARELLASRLIQPFLTSQVGIGTGKIIDSTGNKSREMDILIYSASILPPLLYGDRFGVFPVESCLYTVEVKSKLNATEMKRSIESARNLGSFKMVSQRPLVIPTLFAFDSSLKKDPKAEIARYREYDRDADTCPAIKAFCIVGRGYWYFWREGTNAHWHYVKATPKRDEVIAFVTGVVNTIPRMLGQASYPRFGHYIADSDIQMLDT